MELNGNWVCKNNQTISVETAPRLTHTFTHDSRPVVSRVGSRGPSDTKIHGCSSPVYKVAQYLRMTYAHLPVHFELSLDYL